VTFTAYAYAFPSPLLGRRMGLVFGGGDLHPQRLLAAYSIGIYPWYTPGGPMLWWSPDPRCILRLEDFHLPKRCRRVLARRPFSLTLDRAFGEVMKQCAAPRGEERGTWLGKDMRRAYQRLHEMGYGHSVEAWRDGELAGGLYGIALGRTFFGESMFHRESEASRCCLAGLATLLRQRGATWLDCQQETPHMVGMGAAAVPRREFLELLAEALAEDGLVFRMPAREPEEVYANGPSEVPEGVPVHEECPWRPWAERYVHDPDADAWIEVPADGPPSGA
jgi:leucyl/phenylalanyl-tRNA--protein transferase